MSEKAKAEFLEKLRLMPVEWQIRFYLMTICWRSYRA